MVVDEQTFKDPASTHHLRLLLAFFALHGLLSGCRGFRKLFHLLFEKQDFLLQSRNLLVPLCDLLPEPAAFALQWRLKTDRCRLVGAHSFFRGHCGAKVKVTESYKGV